MSRLGEKLKHELRELTPVTLFFFGTFQLLALTQALMPRESLPCSFTKGRDPDAAREAHQS